jgi:tRNA threonylcarbamoyl adenosine modification protein YeaZ
VLGGCERRLTLGVFKAEPGPKAQLLAAQQWEATGRMAEVLGPALAQMLGLLKLAPEDIGALACLRGPGSFTGLRIVLAFAEGFSLPRRLPRAGLSHTEALVRSARGSLTRRSVVLTHARTRQVYVQVFEDLAAVSDVRVMDIAAAQGLVLQGPSNQTTALGSGLRRNAALAQALKEAGVRLLDDSFDEPSVQAMADLALEAEFRDEPVAPLYLRPSDAEENLAGVARSRGLSPEQADQALAAARSPRG